VKFPVDEIGVDEKGLVGDAHAGTQNRQVSLLAQESVDQLGAEVGREFAPGTFAENITLRGIDFQRVALLDAFRIGTCELQVTQIGKACHGNGCAIFGEIGRCVMPKEGVFCRVLKGGTIRPGERVKYFPRTLGFMIVTLSDRAFHGDYEDRSGPRIKELLETFLCGKRWHPYFEQIVLPDDGNRLRTELIRAKDEGVNVIFTTGGTGVSPRDITPEIVESICDRTIPGIMDAIRIKFGLQNPKALLSRSIAGVARNTLIYTLPGSVRAVEEYMEEILKTLEHLILTIHGLDAH
jgi:molybdenum cofactor synthesis domain-containing protein